MTLLRRKPISEKPYDHSDIRCGYNNADIPGTVRTDQKHWGTFHDTVQG